jgi:hypothetical protein
MHAVSVQPGVVGTATASRITFQRLSVPSTGRPLLLVLLMLLLMVLLLLLLLLLLLPRPLPP